MNERIVIGLTGYSGAGKTTCANWLSQMHSFTLFEGSTSIAREAASRNIVLESRADYELFFRKTQQEVGPDWLSTEALLHSGNRIAHVGLRSRADFNQVRKASGIVIGLVCPDTICFDRLDSSLSKNASTLEEYRQHRNIETAPDIAGSSTDWVIDHADYQIDTSKPVLEVYDELDEIIEQQLR